MQDVFAKTLQRAIDLSNRAAGRTDSRSLRDQTKAAGILRALTHRLRGRTPLERWNVRRHYYRAIGDYRRIIALGHAEIARGNRLGVLSLAFGHSDEALRLWRAGQTARAMTHARSACKAFQRILRMDGPKANRLIAYAANLAMVGDAKQAAKIEAQALKAGLSKPEWNHYRQRLRELQA